MSPAPAGRQESTGERARLFVALPLPAGVAQAVAALRPRRAAGVRPVRRADLHITLHFLGDASAAAVEAALATVEADRFACRLGETGHFALRGGRRVLWVGIEAPPALQALHDAVGRALAPTGFEPERRRYRPHITLARLAPEAPARVVAAFEAGRAPGRIFDCECFALYSSRTEASGARYRVIRTFPLGRD